MQTIWYTFPTISNRWWRLKNVCLINKDGIAVILTGISIVETRIIVGRLVADAIEYECMGEKKNELFVNSI